MNAYVIGADILGATSDYAMIRAVQARLAQLGYPVKQTGVLDKATDDALFKFAGKRGMPDATTMSKLSAPTYGYDQGPPAPVMTPRAPGTFSQPTPDVMTPRAPGTFSQPAFSQPDVMTPQAPGTFSQQPAFSQPDVMTPRAPGTFSSFASPPEPSPIPAPSSTWKIVTGVVGGALALALGAILIFKRPSGQARHA